MNQQKNWSVLIIVAIVSVIVSYVVASKVIVTPAHRQQSVQVVPAIDTTFEQPDTKYFNSNAIDPTKVITIGNNKNSAPFNNTQQ